MFLDSSGYIQFVLKSNGAKIFARTQNRQTAVGFMDLVHWMDGALDRGGGSYCGSKPPFIPLLTIVCHLEMSVFSLRLAIVNG